MAKRRAGGAGPGQGSAKIAKQKQNQSSQQSSKQSSLLAANPYAALANEGVPKKEKMPPFYVRAINGDLKADLDTLIKRGLKASIKLCTEGYKVIVPSSQHYKAVEEYLRQKQAKYFTHDIESQKPFKAVLRGLYDMDNEELKALLTQLGLKVVAIHKIRRKLTNIKYRDQLYLVHLENGSTNLKELKAIRAVANVIVEWERYKPIHRDVTQCTKCFNFGHGARNCHMNPRCVKCGGDHDADLCVTEVLIAKCCNCDGDHPSTDRSCPKRVAFIQMRRSAAARRTQQTKRNQTILNPADFPPIPQPRPRYPVPNLEPLPRNKQSGSGSGQNQAQVAGGNQQYQAAPSTSQPNQTPSTSWQNSTPCFSEDQTRSSVSPGPPGFQTYAQVFKEPSNTAADSGDAANEELFTGKEMFAMLQELLDLLQNARTKEDQLKVVANYAIKILYG